MKAHQIVVTSANSPVTYPINDRGGSRGIAATPAGSGNYTVTFVLTPLEEGLTLNPIPIADMTTETAIASAQLGPATAIIITLHSGTSVTVDVTQSDV